MDQTEQISAFSDKLDALCKRFSDEFDLSSAAVCGVLLMKIRLIQDNVISRSGEV